MCGRYYIDDTTEKEVYSILGNISQYTDTEQMHGGDIFPSRSDLVIKNQNGHLAAEFILHKTPALLKSSTEYEKIRLF